MLEIQAGLVCQYTPVEKKKIFFDKREIKNIRNYV